VRREWWETLVCVAGRLHSRLRFARVSGEYISGSPRSARAWGEHTLPIRSEDDHSHVISGCASADKFLSHCIFDGEACSRAYDGCRKISCYSELIREISQLRAEHQNLCPSSTSQVHEKGGARSTQSTFEPQALAPPLSPPLCQPMQRAFLFLTRLPAANHPSTHPLIHIQTYLQPLRPLPRPSHPSSNHTPPLPIFCITKWPVWEHGRLINLVAYKPPPTTTSIINFANM
jgi:hypothetical protein